MSHQHLRAGQVTVTGTSSFRPMTPAAVMVAIAVAVATLPVAAVSAGCTRSGSDDRRPDVLIIGVDLPMQGPSSASSTSALDAMRLYLDGIGSRAGRRFHVKLKVYDNSTPARDTWDPALCAENAERHWRTAAEVAVIGPRSSDCAAIEVPILNQARGGPLLMVSPRSTKPGLTKNADLYEPEKYYPSGRRSFARVVPTDDYQGAAAAQFAAKDLGVRRCYLLDDGQTYGKGVVETFAAEKKMDIVGMQSWDGSQPNYRAMFVEIQRQRPDCVVVAGLFDHHGDQLIRDKVAVLGDNFAVKLLASDGFSGYQDLQRLPEADGMYLTYTGLESEAILSASGAGARLADAYQTSHGPLANPDLALYSVQALQVVLAAIERSDGSRGGVLRAVFTGSGISIGRDVAVLGRDVTIDPATGDVTSRDVSIKQLREGHEALLKNWPVA